MIFSTVFDIDSEAEVTAFNKTCGWGKPRLKDRKRVCIGKELQDRHFCHQWKMSHMLSEKS